MNRENTQQLLKEFSNLYKQHKLPMTQTCMCWGFDVGDGWFKLIYDLSKAITELDDTVEASQVKEKYGTLRFYTSGGNKETWEQIQDLIIKAEDLSGETCEQCGEKGKERGHGWLSTRCDSCYKKEEEGEKKRDGRND